MSDTMLYVDALGDPCPELPVPIPPRAGERVDFVGRVFDWIRPLMLARLMRLRYQPDLTADPVLDIRVYLQDLEVGP